MTKKDSMEKALARPSESTEINLGQETNKLMSTIRMHYNEDVRSTPTLKRAQTYLDPKVNNLPFIWEPLEPIRGIVARFKVRSVMIIRSWGS